MCVYALMLCLTLVPSTALAQVSFDVYGARALGMAGAFVAVADDSTAVQWNPSALIHGPMAGLTIGSDQFHFRDQSGPPSVGAGRVSARGLAIGAWPIGLSYVRVDAAAIRRDFGGLETADALRTSQFGVTMLQSLGDLVVIGSTLKYVRGTAVSEPVSATSARSALDQALNSAGRTSNKFDFDVGLILATGRVRAGVTLKNLQRPGFATIGEKTIRLERRVRFGLAAFPRDGLTLAIDVDLDTADPLVGLRRTIALGAEKRLGQRIALRGGLRFERGSDARPVGALGGSIRLRQSLWLDGYVAHGHAAGDRGLGIGLRVGS